MSYPKNPVAVCVDSKLIASAPAKFFVAGMGDALATGYEMEAVYKCNGMNCVGGRVLQTGENDLM